MLNRMEDLPFLNLLDSHIEELEERIQGLRNRMVTMSIAKYATKNQEILLDNMLQIRKDMAALRNELISTVEATPNDI